MTMQTGILFLCDILTLKNENVNRVNEIIMAKFPKGKTYFSVDTVDEKDSCKRIQVNLSAQLFRVTYIQMQYILKGSCSSYAATYHVLLYL